MGLLPSEKVVIQAPMSFTGSAKRIWRRLPAGRPGVVAALLGTVAVVLIMFAWTAILCWYMALGLLVVPWRLVRRGGRREKAERLRHREVMQSLKEEGNR